MGECWTAKYYCKCHGVIFSAQIQKQRFMHLSSISTWQISSFIAPSPRSWTLLLLLGKRLHSHPHFRMLCPPHLATSKLYALKAPFQGTVSSAWSFPDCYVDWRACLMTERRAYQMVELFLTVWVHQLHHKLTCFPLHLLHPFPCVDAPSPQATAEGIKLFGEGQWHSLACSRVTAGWGGGSWCRSGLARCCGSGVWTCVWLAHTCKHFKHSHPENESVLLEQTIIFSGVFPASGASNCFSATRDPMAEVKIASLSVQHLASEISKLFTTNTKELTFCILAD